MADSIVREKLDRLKKPVDNLFFAGVDPEILLTRPAVAIVGSRKPTPYGTQVTTHLATELAKAGVVVISGLAYGVDTLAHTAVVRAGGSTIAVLPSGLAKIYPASHENIAREMQKNGCIISEYPEDHYPRKAEFLERNRIIAALSDAVIVTEAAERSGSLNTAAHAYTMGIPIFAIPGPVTSALSEGTNVLIKRERAYMMTTPDDVLRYLGVSLTEQKSTILSLYEPISAEHMLLRTLHEGTKTTNELLQLLENLDMNAIQQALTELEIEGHVKQNSVGGWTLA